MPERDADHAQVGVRFVDHIEFSDLQKSAVCARVKYSIGVLTGEGVRDAVYGERIEDPTTVLPTERVPNQPQSRQSRKWKQYSGLFILLKQKLDLPLKRRRKIYRQVLPAFTCLTQYPVRTHV